MQFLLSLLVALMVYVPGVVGRVHEVFGYEVAEESAPPETAHVTPVFAALVIVVEIERVAPGVTWAVEAGFLVGVETVMLGTVMVTVAVAPSHVG